MDLPKGSVSVWPGYVAAVASLLLSLLLLSGVLVVSMSQVSRLVGAYNQQLLVAIAEDERRQAELVQTRSALHQQDKLSAPAETPKPQASLEALQSQLQLQSAELAKAEAQALNMQEQMRQLAVLTAPAGVFKTYRLTFGAGAQGLDAAAIKSLAAAMGPDELSGGTAWLMQAGVKGTSAAARREVYRLMLGLRGQLRELGVKPDQVSLVLSQERTASEVAGVDQGGDVVIVLQASRDAAKAQKLLKEVRP